MPKPKKAVAPQPDDIEFGLNWTKGGMGGLPELQKRIYCARHGRGTVSVFEHRKRIIQMLWPDYAWHEWTDTRIEGFTKYHFTTWLGPASSGKTSDAAIAALEYWLEAPYETAVIVCSTTKEMLRTRIWGEIVKWHGRINPLYRDVVCPPGYGELLDASCFIRWVDGDWKNGIKGIAIQDGPVQDAVNNIIGMHTTRVFVMLDEMQGVREAIMDAIPNLLKNPESRFHGMGNPSDLNSLLCRYSEPLGGWKSIQKFQAEWDIDSQGYPGVGHCYFFDGRKSPAVKDPEWGKKHPWMINQQQIDNHLRSGKVNGNEGNPHYMWQTIGWPPEKGLEETVLDMSIVNTFLCKEKPIWTNHTIDFISIDPGYEGDDDCVVSLLRRGLTKEGDIPERWVIAGLEQISIPIDASADEPVDYQIVNFVKELGKKKNIPPREVAVPSAGRGAALVSIFQKEWGPVNAIQEGGSPSDRIVDERGRTAKEHYNTRASEICMAIRDYAMGNALRNMPQEVIEQACARYTFTLNGKLCVEPKKTTKGLQQARGQGAKGFKERMGYSPNNLDSVTIGLEHARQMGADSGFGMAAPQKYDDWNKEVVKASQEISDDNYTQEQDWKSEYSEMYVEI